MYIEWSHDLEWGHDINYDLEWGHDINYAHNTATTVTTPTTATATGSGLSGWLDSASTILYPTNDWRHAAELFRQSGAGLWLFNEDSGKVTTINWVDDSFAPASPEEVAELYA